MASRRRDRKPSDRENSTRPRRRKRWLTAIAVVFFALWLALVVARLVGAHADLVQGRAIIERLRSQDVQQLVEGNSLGDVHEADALFRRAHRRLASPVLVPLRFVPVVGRQLHSATSLAGAAAAATALGADGITATRTILEAPHVTGADRLTLAARFAELARSTERRLRAIRLGPAHALISPLARARQELADEIGRLGDGLTRGAAAAEATADVLKGPRRYLLFAANNAEMRAGSGMFLSVGDLQTGDGRFQVSTMTSVIDVPVPPAAVPLGDDLADRWGWLEPNVDWRNLMLSPRFPENAALAAQMWQASGHGQVDGVMAVDPVALREIINAVGPVTVAGRTVDADHVVHELLHDQYVRLPDAADRPERREELSEFASAVLSQLDGGSWSALRLAQGLAAAARGRHLLAWSASAAEEQGWIAAGVSGAVRGDSLLVALLNRGGNKLDQYLSIDAQLELRPAGNHAEGTLRLRMHNGVDAEEPQYIAGPHFGTGLQPGDYLGIAAVTFPGRTEAAGIDGIDQVAVAGPDGETRVIGTEVLIGRDGDRTVVVRFRLPGNHGRLTVEPSARVPPITWHYGTVTWSDQSGHLVRW